MGDIPVHKDLRETIYCTYHYRDAGIQHVDGVTPHDRSSGRRRYSTNDSKEYSSSQRIVFAASTGRANIVQLRLDHGADINEDDYGRAALERARKAGQGDRSAQAER